MIELTTIAGVAVSIWLVNLGVHPDVGLKKEVIPGNFLVLTERSTNASFVLEENDWRWSPHILN